MTCRMWACRCRLIAAVLLMLGGLLGPAADQALAKKELLPRSFRFNIDPKTPLAELLPRAPDGTVPVPPWLVRDLSEVPDILFAKPERPDKRLALPMPTTPEEKRKAAEARMDAEDKAMERTAHVIAKINHVNRDGRDRFLEVLRRKRRDLDGLPFVMGDTCRQNKEQALSFVHAVGFVNDARVSPANGSGPLGASEENAGTRAKRFWALYEEPGTEKRKPLLADLPAALRIAALMQMLAPEDTAMREGLVKHLAGLKETDATRALARLAVYSFDADVRKPALDALRTRDMKECTELLLTALRYPWPTVAANAG